jgi:hypothetical protein
MCSYLRFKVYPNRAFVFSARFRWLGRIDSAFERGSERMAKVYVVDYKATPNRKPEDPGFLEWAVDYAERSDQAATMIEKETAENQCMNLNSFNIKLGAHLCRFKVEQLPSGKYALVCETHL